jgi:tetratricopeptide (TPR) repeat protein
MKSTRLIFILRAIALLNIVYSCYPKTVLAEIDIQQAADKACAVMSGQQRLDPEIFQLLEKASLGTQVGDYSKIAIDLDQQLLKQCPKAYLSFQQRNIINNPLLKNNLLQSINPLATPPENPSAILPGNPSATQSDRTVVISPFQANNQQEMAKYDEAIRLNPNDVGVYLARGKARYDRQNYQEALADYTEAIRLEPKNPLGYANRALAKNYLGDKQGTIADLQIAAKLFEANGDRDNYQRVLNLLKQIVS